MNLHSKLALTISAYVIAVATIVPLAALSANTHPAPAATITTNQTQQDDPLAVIQSTITPAYDPACLEAVKTFCTADADSYWAKDAYTAYAAPIASTTSAHDILSGFVSTYVGTYSTAPSWPGFVAVPSTIHPNVWHVFKMSPSA